jgi:WD40 repeat protein
MDHWPAEIWQRIFVLACIDGGRTGRSLSLVSKYIHDVSKPYKLQSIGVDNVDQAKSFIHLLYSIPIALRSVSHFTISDHRNRLSFDEYIAGERSKRPVLGRISTAVSRITPKVMRSNKAEETERRCRRYWGANSERDVAILHALPIILAIISPTLERLDINFNSSTVPRNFLPSSQPSLPLLTSLTLGCSFDGFIGVILDDILSSNTISLPSLKYLDLSRLMSHTVRIRSAPEVYAHVSVLAPLLTHVRIPMEMAHNLVINGHHLNKLPVTLERVFVQTPMDGTCNEDYLIGSRTFAGCDDRVVRLSQRYEKYPIEELDVLRCRLTRDGSPLNLTLKGHTDRVYCATFSPDGKCIASSGGDGVIRVWDAHTGRSTLEPLQMHIGAVFCVAFSPDSRKIASGGADNTILLWDVVTGEVIGLLLGGHTRPITCISFSSDGKQITSGSEDMTIQIWDVQTGRQVTDPLKGHTDFVAAAVFSGDDTRIVSGSWDTTVIVWDAKSGQLVHGPMRGHTERALFAAFSPDGKNIISVSRGGNVCVWDADTGALAAGPSQRHEEGALAVIFTPYSTLYALSPNGKWVERCNGGDSQIIQICDSMTGMIAATFEEHTDRITSIAFSPDSRRIVSTSDDWTVQLHTLDC